MSQRDVAEMCSSSSAELWDLAVANRLCVLVTGPSVATRVFVAAHGTTLPGPVVDVACDEQPVLSGWEAGETVVLHDIDRADVAAQRQILERLDAVGGQTQVVSTSSRPLLPLIARGEFLATLYYRLNTVYIDLSGPAGF